MSTTLTITSQTIMLHHTTGSMVKGGKHQQGMMHTTKSGKHADDKKEMLLELPRHRPRHRPRHHHVYRLTQCSNSGTTTSGSTATDDIHVDVKCLSAVCCYVVFVCR
jgi:hypothetical protein